VLDADKEGYLRSRTSLIQTIGRAARHVDGRAILYAERVTEAMRRAIDETARRRAIQAAHNAQHGITPTGIQKAIRDLSARLRLTAEARPADAPVGKEDVARLILDLERQMRQAAQSLQYERAALLRDQVHALRANLADAELALAADGRFLALRAHLYADLGAYLYPTTAVPAHTTAMLLTGAYAISAADVTIVGARTNKAPTGPYRGAGRPEAALVIERLVELAARELGVDPFELRRRNFVPRDAFPYETALGWVYDSGDYERCLDRALELLGLEEWQAERERARREGRVVGIGAGMVIERCGGLWERARVEVAPDGAVVVRTGSSPHGQGHETTFAQIAADELGVAPEEVTVRWGDTEEVPAGIGTFASRSVAMGGAAVVQACREIRSAAGETALREAAAEAGGLSAAARFESPLVFSSGAYAAAVEVERATGRLHILRLAAADDPGTVVNPLLAEGQVLGAVTQGLGECLAEEAVYDDEGQPRTASFADYKLLTAAEIPTVATAFLETPSPHNPLGAKGVGEAGAIGTPAAVANAVADALAAEGLPGLDPPFTEERLWQALNDKEG
jgi:carbon-monoxide dehydrogenase large subunit